MYQYDFGQSNYAPCGYDPYGYGQFGGYYQLDYPSDISGPHGCNHIGYPPNQIRLIFRSSSIRAGRLL